MALYMNFSKSRAVRTAASYGPPPSSAANEIAESRKKQLIN